MYTALYRRYRPKTFNEIVGQDHIVKILKNQIITGKTAHAYLFCGTRGTGKTSAARIFAKGVNCLSKEEKPCGKCENCRSIQQGIFFDVIEIDAASNNRVDNIRELRESVKYPPAAGLCKVYIIDEVHMLSTGAFNALLKTLEEPPEHVIFILATTEPHKLPATILSRCLRLDFRRVPEQKIREKLTEICEELGLEYEDSAVSLIAANGDGSVRDALSILEQCISSGEKTLMRKDVVDILGTAGEDVFLRITDRVFKGDTAGAFMVVEEIARDGKDMMQFIKDWTYHFRNIMMSKFAEKLEDIMNMSCENVEKVKAQGAEMGMEFISAALTELSSTLNKARYSSQARTLLEVSILKLSHPAVSDEREAVLQRIEKIERTLASGNSHDKVYTGNAPGKGEKIGDKTEETVQSVKMTVTEELPEKEEDPAEKEEYPAGAAHGSEKTPEKLWAEAFALSVKDRASLKIFTDDVVVKGLQADTLLLEVSSELKKNMMEKNAALIEKHLENLRGKKTRIHAALSKVGPDNGGDEKDTKTLLEELLGADKLTVIE
ncbi:MAG: DNA polymerase III subunit gamma/tau [Bacillota bacterium]|nr:DNA polymerase III subunit gamma/tau [Bacillota bacterium]